MSYSVAYSGARTAKGGVVVGSCGACVSDSKGASFKGAVVGDLVRYADGSEAAITSGAGFGFMNDNKPVAIVGSHVSGGDHIVSTHVVGVMLGIDEDDRPDGFLVEGWARRG